MIHHEPGSESRFVKNRPPIREDLFYTKSPKIIGQYADFWRIEHQEDFIKVKKGLEKEDKKDYEGRYWIV